MTLVHIGIFGAGFLAGYLFCKNQKKGFANLTAGDLQADWEYCTNKCYPKGSAPVGGYNCLRDCMKKRGNPINY